MKENAKNVNILQKSLCPSFTQLLIKLSQMKTETMGKSAFSWRSQVGMPNSRAAMELVPGEWMTEESYATMRV